MTGIINLYALASVTLRGDIILIPAIDLENTQYPYDLAIVLPQFLFNPKKGILPFLKFLNLINFHYREKLLVSALIEIKVDSLLDKLFQFYLKTWDKYSQLSAIPERRHTAEMEIIKWSASLPTSPLGKFIHRYYSASLESTDWKSKAAIWKSLKHIRERKPELSQKKLEKLKEKYIEIWFEFFDKISFSPEVQSTYPEFMELMNQLTFKEILSEIPERLCPNCERDLNAYPTSIQFCPQCGYALFHGDQKYCSSCGAPLRDGALFCSNCGKKLL